MTYTKPEMEIEKFDLIEEIAADAESATAGDIGTNSVQNGGDIVDESIGSDLIIG